MIGLPATGAPPVGTQSLRGNARLIPGVVVAAWATSRLLAGLSLVFGDWLDSQQLRWDGLIGWDAGWYLEIARNGYPDVPLPTERSPIPETSWPFFPLLPAIARGLAELGLSGRYAIVLVQNLAFLVGLAGVHRIAARHFGTQVAWWAVWVIALFPGSVTSVMGYSGALFLSGAVWAFVLVEERRPAWAVGAAALVATASRPNGVLLLLGLVPAVLATRLPAGVPLRESLPGALRSAWRPVVAVSLPSIALLVGWCAWLHARSGDALVFIQAKKAWHETSVVSFLRDPYGTAVVHVALAIVAIAAVALVRRKLPLGWHVLVVVYLIPPIVLGVVGLGRYAAECFPIAIAIAVVVMAAPRWMRGAYLAASAGSLVVMAVLVGHGRLTP